MARITAVYRGDLARTIGYKSEPMVADTVRDVIRFIRKKHGRHVAKTAKSMLIVVDGVSIQLLERYRTKLNSGSEVSFLPVSAGG